MATATIEARLTRASIATIEARAARAGRIERPHSRHARRHRRDRFRAAPPRCSIRRASISLAATPSTQPRFERSRQSGFIDTIRSIFHSRSQCLMFFPCEWRSCMLFEIDEPLTPYRCVKPLTKPFGARIRDGRDCVVTHDVQRDGLLARMRTECYFTSATCFSCASPRSKSGPSICSMLMNRQIALPTKLCLPVMVQITLV